MTEFIVNLCEGYMTEQVNYDGKSKNDSRNYSGWSAHTTRLSHMIDKYLQFEVERAVKSMLQDANTKIGQSMAEAVKIALADVTKAMNVTVKTS